ncbi:MAG: hypothetical protein QM724_10995 [Flavobacteriales bacterium]
MRLRVPSLLIAAIACAALQAQPAAPVWKTWRTKACSLNYPGDWALNNTGTEGTTVMVLAPEDSAKHYRSHVDLVTLDTKGADLQGFLEAAEQRLRAEVSGLTMLRSETERAPAEVHTFEYTGRMDGRELRFRQMVRVAKGKAYLLTYVAEPDLYDEHLYLADAIQNSFSLTR